MTEKHVPSRFVSLTASLRKLGTAMGQTEFPGGYLAVMDRDKQDPESWSIDNPAWGRDGKTLEHADHVARMFVRYARRECGSRPRRAMIWTRTEVASGFFFQLKYDLLAFVGFEGLSGTSKNAAFLALGLAMSSLVRKEELHQMISIGAFGDAGTIIREFNSMAHQCSWQYLIVEALAEA